MFYRFLVLFFMIRTIGGSTICVVAELGGAMADNESRRHSGTDGSGRPESALERASAQNNLHQVTCRGRRARHVWPVPQSPVRVPRCSFMLERRGERHANRERVSRRQGQSSTFPPRGRGDLRTSPWGRLLNVVEFPWSGLL